MTPHAVRLNNLSELRDFVLERLSARENLLADQFPLTESKLVRGGRECGRQFVLHGPRSVRLNAIWVADRNDVYFYDAAGERFDKVRIEVDEITQGN